VIILFNPIIEEDLHYIKSLPLPWAQLKGKTVLITGANGFIPSYLVDFLLFLNENSIPVNIIGIARNQEHASARFFRYLEKDHFKLMIQDVCEPIGIEEPINYVIHAASQASPKYFSKDPCGTLLPNVSGTYNLLELSRTKQIEAFLFISSGEVYGEFSKDRVSIRENDYGPLDPTNIRSCYAESKRMGETMCRSWQHQFGVPIKIARLSHTYGPGMRLDDGRVFADFVSDIVNKRDIVLKSDGTAKRPFCYIADTVSGIFTVLLKGLIGHAYNVGSVNEISILDLANLLIELFPEDNLKVIKDITDISSDYSRSNVLQGHFDISKMNALGWDPIYSLEEGFKRTVSSYKFSL
jgi:nucleoside-diphosphate-sugar epimerase